MHPFVTKLITTIKGMWKTYPVNFGIGIFVTLIGVSGLPYWLAYINALILGPLNLYLTYRLYVKTR